MNQNNQQPGSADLPPLPEDHYMLPGQQRAVFDADHMYAYARAAVSAATKPTADLSKLRDLADAYRDASPISKVGERCNLDIAFDELAVYVQSLLATKPAAAPALPTEWRATLEHAANKLVTMSRVLAPDEEAIRLITELRAVSEALAAGAEGVE